MTWLLAFADETFQTIYIKRQLKTNDMHSYIHQETPRGIVFVWLPFQ